MKQLIALIFLTVTLFSACNKAQEVKTEPINQNKTSVTEDKRGSDSTLIRSTNVDVSSLDLNKDSKVFQCPMDYEVISDHQASCPKCKMDLEEVSVVEAQKNLK